MLHWQSCVTCHVFVLPLSMEQITSSVMVAFMCTNQQTVIKNICCHHTHAHTHASNHLYLRLLTFSSRSNCSGELHKWCPGGRWGQQLVVHNHLLHHPLHIHPPLQHNNQPCKGKHAGVPELLISHKILMWNTMIFNLITDNFSGFARKSIK